MARFYGWSNSQILELSLDEFISYTSCISKVEAIEEMQKSIITDWPNLKEDARSKKWNSLKKLASIEEPKTKQNKLTNKELFAILNAR